jgi:uncharacterized membrane protein YdjX (TVP38/TMEM64 family)
MSTLRASGISLVCQTMQTFAFPFSSLNTTAAFSAAFGTLAGALYASGAGIAITALAVAGGRLLLGDLLPLYNQRRGAEILAPSAPWTWWAAAAMAALPGFPLIICGLWLGVFRLSLFRSMTAIAVGIIIRVFISLAAY